MQPHLGDEGLRGSVPLSRSLLSGTAKRNSFSFTHRSNDGLYLENPQNKNEERKNKKIKKGKHLKKKLFRRPTNRSCSYDFPAKQLFLILFIATSDPRHFP